MPPPMNEQHAKERKRARRRKQPASNIVLPEEAAVGSGRVPLLNSAAPDPFVASAFDFSASYDKQASDIITNYKTSQAKRLFNIMADDVKKCCEELLVQEKGVNGETRCAIKGVVTSRLKGDEPLETKLTSADGKQFFLGWFEKAVEMGKNQARLLDSPNMGDLAAVRIGLYLPGDVIKVARRLKQDFDVKHPFGTVMDPTRKAAMMGNQHFTRHDRGRFEEGEDPDDATWEHYGYKSWQVVVGWACNKTQWDEDLQAMARLFSPLKVEIQVGTVVTQAWAEVQHNIIYKQPKDIRVTYTIKRMIDATNGMAITTDIILRELERSYDEAKAEAEARRQRDREQPWWSLLEYCKTDDEIKAKEIIDSGFDLSTLEGSSGDTALHTACGFGASKVALAMLDSLDEEAAARIVRIKNGLNRTALQMAAQNQRLAISVWF
ncbi:RelA/SpoT [Akanthomyces lecanii RCEF 1005]|uniref:RelA/SpoT n=1 Tax=Akanthomyces lecanii RCEF 1005 TaxID=1081108 RepID=A0A162KH53_CORDF|nr:RelA/SpoT [Akanthomyces lecanii RCEF 1005]